MALPDIRALCKLNGTNFQVWQFAVSNVLELYDLLDVAEVVYHLHAPKLFHPIDRFQFILSRGLKIDLLQLWMPKDQ